MVVRVAARQSDLAQIQAFSFARVLKDAHPEVEIKHHFRESLGDKNLEDPLWKMPEQGVFTQDFYKDLVEGAQDLVVHSWKDLPVEEREHTEIYSTLPREDMRDLLLVKKSSIQDFVDKKEIHILSSSPRRAYNLTPFLKKALPFQSEEAEIHFHSVRGNVQTRCRKLIEGGQHALIVAKAALDRMFGFSDAAVGDTFLQMQSEMKEMFEQLDWMVLPLSVNPCAAAQGALAVEIRRDREDLKDLLRSINCSSTFSAAGKEREILSSYGGGCHQKIGVSVLDRPFGQVTFLQGLTDAGEVLASSKLMRSQNFNWPKSSSEKCFPFDMKEAKFFTRKPLSVDYESLVEKNLWVGRANAWPEGLQNSGLVWCSGVKTWQKLARKGVWVNGCAEGLGEKEEARLEELSGVKNLSWLKLTHTDGIGENKLATYELIERDAEIDLSAKTHFYWSSYSQYKHAVNKAPEVKSGYHACGPGHTFELIKKDLSDESRVAVFLSHEHWLKETVSGEE